MKTEEIVADFKKYVEDKDKATLETTIKKLLDLGWTNDKINQEMQSILVLVKDRKSVV